MRTQRQTDWSISLAVVYQGFLPWGCAQSLGEHVQGPSTPSSSRKCACSLCVCKEVLDLLSLGVCQAARLCVFWLRKLSCASSRLASAPVPQELNQQPVLGALTRLSLAIHASGAQRPHQCAKPSSAQPTLFPLLPSSCPTVPCPLLRWWSRVSRSIRQPHFPYRTEGAC